LNKRAQVTVRVAGLWIRHGSILVGRNPRIGREWALPGGSLEVGETLREGCRREFREELGFEVDCDALAIAMEQRYRYEGELIHELGYYFWITPKREFSEPLPVIRSSEAEMQFEWFPVDRLEELEFVPPTLVEHVPQLVAGKTIFVSSIHD
jgi:8-oxo-dGTP pyrophosphatase MutT (NUDIX family)